MAKKVESIGFITKPTETEQIVSALFDENKRLLASLDSTQKELIDTRKKLDRANSQLAETNNKVAEITPYMDSQKAYIGDSSVKFENVYGNLVTAYCETDSGVIVTTRIEKTNNTVNVFFEQLEEVATVTISAL